MTDNEEQDKWYSNMLTMSKTEGQHFSTIKLWTALTPGGAYDEQLMTGQRHGHHKVWPGAWSGAHESKL